MNTIDRLRSDVTYALRQWRRSPGFAIAALVSLALGIGANTALFSVLNAVLFRSLPVSAPSELFVVRKDAAVPSPQRFAYRDFEAMRDSVARVDVAAMSQNARVNVIVGSNTEAQRANVQLVSGDFFHVMRVPPALGRLFGPDDDRTPGAHPIVVLSHAYWTTQFAAASDVVGKTIALNGSRMTVVGVARAGFTGVVLEAPTDIWVPTMMQSDVRYHQNFSADDNGQPEKPWVPQDGISWLDVIVRTNGDTARIIGSFDGAYKTRLTPPVPGMRLVLDSFASGRSRLRDRFTPTLYALMAMVVLVLIIACANTANLLLARSAARQRELAVRLAIGAGRRRLVQQLLTESVLLACVSAGGGLLLALWSADAIVALVVRSLTGSPTSIIAIDARVLAFTMATSVFTGVLFGLAPVRRAMRLDLSAALKSGGKRAGGTDAATGKFVIAAQVALSLLLVTGAGLFSRSLYNLAHVELGFQPENVVTIAVNPRTSGVTADALPALYRRVLDGIVALPTVKSAAWAECELAGGCRSASGGIVVSGYTPAPSEDVTFQENRVSAEYLQTVGLRLLRGRNFDASDRRETRKVAIVNEALVRRYFAGREPIGQRFGYQTPDIEIVGVIANARVYTAREAAEPMAYYPIDQTAQYAASLSVRTVGDPQDALNSVRRALQAAAPNLIIERIATLEQRIDNNLTADRIAAMLAAAFGVLAVVLACVGVYALLSYSVARRTSEIGVRMALGARPVAVLRATLMESLRPIAIGLLIGIPLAAAAGRGVSNILFGVEPWDAQVVTVAAVAVLALGLSAAFIPAWRASRVDPIVALRQD